jgi:hypothetical protein
MDVCLRLHLPLDRHIYHAGHWCRFKSGLTTVGEFAGCGDCVGQ